MIKTRRINLADPNQRSKDSARLQALEALFSYPLGTERFQIVHGASTPFDYFSYFESLGTPSVMVLEEHDRIVGAICAVLRTIEGRKVWYLCDYKIAPNYRGRKLYRQLMLAHFWHHYRQCSSMYGINMSPPKSNGLVAQAQRVFALFNVKAPCLYLHQCTYSDYQSAPLNGYTLCTTQGLKDIVINGSAYPIYHLLDPAAQKRLSNSSFSPVDPAHALGSAQVMLVSSNSHSPLSNASSQPISFIHRRGNFFIPSSAEI